MESFELFEELFEEFPLSLIIGTFCAFIFLILGLILYSKGFIFSKGRKKLEYAMEAGHVVNAILISYKSHSNNGSARTYSGRYVYEVDGAKYYKYIQTGSGLPGDNCTLYYENDPRKAKTASEMIGSFHQLLLVLVPFLFGACIALRLGYRP